MNIQIKPKARSKKDAKARKAPKNVFAGEDESDDDNTVKRKVDDTLQQSRNRPPSKTYSSLSQQQRAAVNLSIVQEQEAMYQQQAKTAVEYDFDGTYETGHSQHQQRSSSAKQEDDKKSKYIGDLLKAAERRKRTHDLVYERNVAREQAQEEEADPELRGKDRFITTAYKRKLRQQKQWKVEEEEEEREEQQNDVTKRGTMAHFYGNFSKNVAVGGTAKDRNPSPDTNLPPFSDGFAKDEVTEDLSQTDSGNLEAHAENPKGEVTTNAKTQETTEQRRLRQRKEREERVAAALERYLLRHPSLATA